MTIQRAMVVDDSRLARYGLVRLLERHGLKVAATDSGEKALAELRRQSADNRPHVIFMDYMMPGMDGYETARAISGDPELKAIPVVMCTSQDDEAGERSKAQANGAFDLINKPATEESLKRVLAALMQRERAGKKTTAEPAASDTRADQAIGSGATMEIEALKAELKAFIQDEVRRQLEQALSKARSRR